MDDSLLQRYRQQFLAVHRNQNARMGSAPHKPILLLAILDGIERGEINENRVTLTPALVAAFRTYWRALVPDGTWQERIIYPFRYLASDGFWELVKGEINVPDAALGHPTSIGQLTELVDYGRFIPGLWELLAHDSAARSFLRSTLLAAYFPDNTLASDQAFVQTDPLTLEIERLITEAGQTRFRTRPVPRLEQETDAAFVRHYLFPRVVTTLYQNTCSVCRLGVWGDLAGTIVDAAHVLPFARFHNDDPRNGLALCKNHHWGFDRGWFTITEDYRVRRSSRLNAASGPYLEEGVRLLLPSDPQYAPAPESLKWHANNVFLP